LCLDLVRYPAKLPGGGVIAFKAAHHLLPGH